MLKILKKIPFAIIIIILISMIIYTDFKPIKDKIDAVQGQVNLSDFKFEEQGLFNLKGEWEFYYNQLLSPEDFNITNINKPKLTGYIKVPSTWSGLVGNEKLNSKGVGTYRLIVDVGQYQHMLGIRLSNIKMASKLFINGNLYGESGKVGDNYKEYQAENRQYVSYFKNDNSKVEIIIQVSNFDSKIGGICQHIYFGLQKDIRFFDMIINVSELAGIFTLLLLSSQLVSLYYIRRNDKSLLYASIYLFLMGIAMATNGEKLLFEAFSLIPFEIARKMQGYACNLSIIVLAHFFRSIKKEFVSDKFVKLIYIIFIPYLILITVSPYHVYTYFDSVIFLILALIKIKILINLIREYIYNHEYKVDRKELKIIIIALINVIIFSITSVLYYCNTINTEMITVITFTAFITCMCKFMSHRFLMAYINVEKMSEQLIKIDKLKDEFLAKTSHELKTPLHGIINISESLSERKMDDMHNNKDLMLITNIGLRLSSIIDDILDLIRLKNDELLVKITSVDLRGCVSLTLDIFNYIAKGKNIIFINEVEEDYNVLADERRLRQILCNLINNAVKYTDKGYIKISSKKINENIYVYVEDTGIGISKERQSKIFRTYEKLESINMGLGLCITLQLLEKMNGSICLEWSEEGKGSRFAFFLPVAQSKNYFGDEKNKIDLKPDILYDEDKLEYYNGPESSTILIVNYEIVDIKVAFSILSNEGYNLLSAFSAEEALNKIEENKKIDLIILDIMMPKISGIEICRNIREKYSLIDLPILICTERNINQEIFIGFEAGANDFITKPFDGKEVKARVRTLITMKNSVKEALRSELAFLQSQIKPHFLYNAINTIVFFCYTDGEKAAQLLTDFSNYLRLSFDIDNRSENATIERELELTKAYVAIEKARFGDKIKVQYNVDSYLLNTKIPILTIQPLVENAIRHGLCKKEIGGSVMITIKQDNNEIVIQIKDTGIGMSKETIDDLKNIKKEKKGVGFANVNKRISRLKGNALSIESIEGVGTSITIRL